MILLSGKSLRKIIRETVIHGKDLDCCLIESVFAENLNLGGLASRSIKQGKALVKHEVDGEDYVIVVSKDGDDLNAVAAAVGEKVGDGWWRLRYLHSDEPSSTPLALLGALAFYKKVLADFDVSQSAETLIKSYFQKAKDDPSLIVLDADKQRIEQGRDEGPARAHLRAGYLTPPGVESTAYKSLMIGDDYVSEVAESKGISEKQLKDELVDQSISGFKKAYSAPERTGVEKIPGDVGKKLMDLLGKNDFLQAGTILYNSYAQKSPSKRTWIIDWLKKNESIILNIVKAAIKSGKVDQGLKYFDEFVRRLVKKEAGVSNYTVIGLAGQL